MAASASKPPIIGHVITGGDVAARARVALAGGAGIIALAADDTTSVQRELDSVVPAIETLIAAGISAPIAVASRRALVIDQALEAGATLVRLLEGSPEAAETAGIIALHGAGIVD